MEYTHYLVVDREDGTVLVWFPKHEYDAEERAKYCAQQTGHRLTEGFWTGTQWVLEGPEELKRLLRF